MTTDLRRRVRGIAVSMALWAIPWSLAVLCLIAVLMHSGEMVYVRGDVLHLGPYGMALVLGAVVGAVNGLLFALLLMASQRGRSIGQVSRGIFALVGAIAPAALAGFAFQDMRAAVIAGLLGAGAASLMLWLARRTA